jgi:hypothetical protein
MCSNLPLTYENGTDYSLPELIQYSNLQEKMLKTYKKVTDLTRYIRFLVDEVLNPVSGMYMYENYNSYLRGDTHDTCVTRDTSSPSSSPSPSPSSSPSSCVHNLVQEMEDEIVETAKREWIEYDITSNRTYLELKHQLIVESQCYLENKTAFESQKDSLYQSYLTKVHKILSIPSNGLLDNLMQRYLKMCSRCCCDDCAAGSSYDQNGISNLVHDLELRFINDNYKIAFVPKVDP